MLNFYIKILFTWQSSTEATTWTNTLYYME